MRHLFILLSLLMAGCAPNSSDSVDQQIPSVPTPLPIADVPDINGYHGTWVKQAGILIDISSDPTRFDAGYTSTVKMVYDPIQMHYRAFYTGGLLQDQPGREMFGLANSYSPVGPFQKYDSIGLNRSLFTLGPSWSYDTDRQWGMGTVLAGDVWQMWTVGDSDNTTSHVSAVGYAESYDHGVTWIKHYTAFNRGSVFWDTDGYTSGPRGPLSFCVLKENGRYYAWYVTFGSNAVRLATSTDGISDWSIVGAVNIPQSVTGLGNVVKDGDIYYLTATRPDFTGVVVLASKDRINWKKYDELRVSSEFPWQSAWMAFPFLFKDTVSGTWYLYYTAADKFDDGLSGRVGVAILQ